MTRAPDIHGLRQRGAILARAEDGGVLVELAVVLPVFLLLLFGLIDFGRMGYEYVMASKATDMAARIAATRPAACSGVPAENARGTGLVGGVAPRFGTACGSAANICAAPATATCTASLQNATAAEIWARIAPLLPGSATPANLQFSYSYDPDLGFLGGPYVPVISVEIVNLGFRFSSPLGAMSTLAGGEWQNFSATVPFPAMSSSLPAEDLAQGEAG